MASPSALALVQMRPTLSRGRGVATTAAHLSRRRHHGQAIVVAVLEPMAMPTPVTNAVPKPPPQLPALDLEGVATLDIDIDAEVAKLKCVSEEVALDDARPLFRCGSPDSGFAASRRGSVAGADGDDDKADVVEPAAIEDEGCTPAYLDAPPKVDTGCPTIIASTPRPSLLFAAVPPRTRSSCVELLNLVNDPAGAHVQAATVSSHIGTTRILAGGAQQQQAQPQEKVQQQQMQQKQPQVDVVVTATPATSKPHSIKDRAKRFAAATMNTIKAAFRRDRNPKATAVPESALPYQARAAAAALAKSQPLVLTRLGGLPELVADSFAAVEAHGITRRAIHRGTPAMSDTARVEAMYDASTGVRVSGGFCPTLVSAHALAAKRAYGRLAQPVLPSSSSLLTHPLLLRTEPTPTMTTGPAPATDDALPEVERTRELATLVAKALACPSRSAQRNLLAALIEHLVRLAPHHETTYMSPNELAGLWAYPVFGNAYLSTGEGASAADVVAAAERMHDAAIALLKRMIEHSGVFLVALDEYGGVNVVDDE